MEARPEPLFEGAGMTGLCIYAASKWFSAYVPHDDLMSSCFLTEESAWTRRPVTDPAIELPRKEEPLEEMPELYDHV